MERVPGLGPASAIFKTPGHASASTKTPAGGLAPLFSQHINHVFIQSSDKVIIKNLSVPSARDVAIHVQVVNVVNVPTRRMELMNNRGGAMEEDEAAIRPEVVVEVKINYYFGSFSVTNCQKFSQACGFAVRF